MAFISGNNMGGKEVKYYDNPNYDPKNEGKSKIDRALAKAAESADNAANINEQFYNVGIDFDYVVEAENEAAYDALKLKQQQDATISYFRAKERANLNKDYPDVGKNINNPKFSQPVPLEDKLSRVEPSYDDWLDNQVDTAKAERAFDDMYGRDSAPNSYFERPPVNNNSVKIKGDGPLPKTVAGLNQDLQAIKQRTRDVAMEFKGRVYDFIEEVTQDFDKDFAYQSIDFDSIGDVSGVGRGVAGLPQGYSYIENKYFPNSRDKQKARDIILKIIDDTGYNKMPTNSLRGVTEELAAIKEPIFRDLGIGVSPMNTDIVSNKKTLANLQKGITEFSNWKAKKGVPRLVRLLQNLP